MDQPNLDPAYVQATIEAESHGDPNAVSPVGAKGQMQVMDTTGQPIFERLKAQGRFPEDATYDPTNSEQNIAIGSDYLQQQVNDFGDTKLGSAAYNWGPQAVKDTQKKYGPNYEDIVGHLPPETQKYVERVQNNYNKLKGQNTPQNPLESSKLNDTIASAPNTAQGLAKSYLELVNDPGFSLMPFNDQVQAVGEVFKAKNWSKDGFEVYKGLMKHIWDSADPDELPNLNDVVGTPPIIQYNQDPSRALQDWRISKTQELLRKGVSPAAFGGRLESYFDSATNSEKEAFNARNEGYFRQGLDATGNFLRGAAKGFVASGTAAIAGLERFASKDILNTLISAGVASEASGIEPITTPEQQEAVANFIEKVPEYLGKPASTNYATDKNGFLKLNPDGTPQLLAQSHASDFVGQVFGQVAAIASGGAELKVIGGAKTAFAGLFGYGALTQASQTYGRVFEDTGGDTEKASTAAMLAAPTALFYSIGELSIFARTLNPAFTTMSKMDQARYAALALTKNVGIGTASGALGDATQQAAEISQTGKPFDYNRNIQVAGGFAIASGLAGTASDYFGGKAEFNQNKAAVGEALVKFRDSPEQTITLLTRSIPPDFVKLYGLTVAPDGKGGSVITKNTTGPIEGDLPSLIGALNNRFTPDEIIAANKRLGELSSKDNPTPDEKAELDKLSATTQETNKAEYHNTTKAVENAIRTELEANPGALMARYDPQKGVWYHPETGEESPHLKDIIKPVAEEPIVDLSDKSGIRILDEDTIKNRQFTEEVPINPKAHEEQVNAQRVLDQVNDQILQLQNKKAKLELAGADKETIDEVNQQIKVATIGQRDAKRALLKLKPTLDIEEANRNAFNIRKKEFESQKKDDLKLINRYRDKALGAIDSKDSTIILTSDMPQVAKEQVLAHELAHSVSDKVSLDETAKQAVSDHIQSLKDLGQTSKAAEVADRALLPEARKLVKVDPELPFKSLYPKSKEALTSEKEVLANQIGALILKRAGKDIGNFQILPEVEAALKNTKLPDLSNGEAPKAAPEVTREDVINQVKEATTGKAPEEPTKPQEPPQVPPKGPNESDAFKTGQQNETALSKTLTEAEPKLTKTFYDEMSAITERPKIRERILKEGIPETIERLSNKEVYNTDPQSRLVWSDELFFAAKDKADKNPTKETADNLDKAQQLRALAASPHAQAMGLLRKIRTPNTFSDLILSINKIYRDAGQEPPKFTDFMLRELTGRYNQMKALPEGSKAQDIAAQRLFETTLKKGKGFNDFLSAYISTNILSGVGTPIKVGGYGGLLAGLFQAFNHPIQGGGLMWKALWESAPFAKANFQLALHGEPEKAIFNQVSDPRPVNVSSKDTIDTNFYKILGKYGWPTRLISALHEGSKTFSGEQRLVQNAYNDLKAKYADDPVKLASEVAKLSIGKDDLNAARTQATNEFNKANYKPSPGEIDARAYEILRLDNAPVGRYEDAINFAKSLSHAGQVANLPQQILNHLINGEFWFWHPALQATRKIVFPVGRAMVGLSDLYQDFIPGNMLLEKALSATGFKTGKFAEKTGIEGRTSALQERLAGAQKIGTVAALALIAASRGGLMKITGEAEDRKGEPAKGTAGFREAAQKGEPEYSLLFPNGLSVEYKDVPGLNVLAYGVHKFNKAIDSGEGLLPATAQFYAGAYSYALPIIGGGTLNQGFYNLISAALNGTGNRLYTAASQVADSVTKELTPYSAALRDLKNIYDNTPRETHQNMVQKLVRDIPGISELSGSEHQITRIGTPVIGRTPGLKVLGDVNTPPEDPVERELQNQGLYIKEMPSNINFFGATSKSARNLDFKAARTSDERLGRAWANVMTPDEWNDYRKATAPFIYNRAAQILSEDIDPAIKQERLDKMVRDIDTQAKKRYIATGQF